MKHLKKFNEELKPYTYTSAGLAFSNLGDEKRARRLLDYGSEKQREKDMNDWEEQKRLFSKYGKFRLTFRENRKTFSGDFYLNIFVINEGSYEDIVYNEEGSIFFNIGLIPVDQKTLDVMTDKSDQEFEHGFFLNGYMTLNFTTSGSSMEFFNFKFSGAYCEAYLADRPSAGRFRNLAKKLFGDPNFDYPMSHVGEQMGSTSFKDLVDTFFGSTLGLSGDYGFDSEMLVDCVNKKSANKLYKIV